MSRRTVGTCLLLLAWSVVPGTAILLWTLGSLGTLRPGDDALTVGLYLLGSLCFAVLGPLWIRTSARWFAILSFLILLGAWCVVGVVLYQSSAGLYLAQVDGRQPEDFATLLGIGLLGAVCLMSHGLLKIRALRTGTPLISFLIGFTTLAAIAVFVYEVLSNDEAAIPVSGRVAPPTEPVKSVRIFNLNVLHGYPTFADQEERYETTARILRHFSADIIVLQEVWHTAQHGNMAERFRLDAQRPLNCVYARVNGSRSRIGFEEGGAVLSSFPILEANRFLLQPRTPWWENRIALLTKLDLGSGETLTLTGVHLSDSVSADDQAEYLLEVMRDHSPDIIAGDFNSEPNSRALEALRKKGFVEAMPSRAIHGSAHLELTDKPANGPWIDHVFLSSTFHERWKVKAASWIFTSKPVTHDPIHARMAVSDHDAILVDLERR